MMSPGRSVASSAFGVITGVCGKRPKCTMIGLSVACLPASMNGENSGSPTWQARTLRPTITSPLRVSESARASGSRLRTSLAISSLWQMKSFVAR